MFFETEENLVVEICYYYGLKQSLVLVGIAIMFFKFALPRWDFPVLLLYKVVVDMFIPKNAHCRTHFNLFLFLGSTEWLWTCLFHKLLIVHVPSLL